MKGRIRRSYTISTISMALVLFILGLVGYTFTSLLSTSQQLREGIVMIVEIDDHLQGEQRDSLSATIAEHPLVRSVKFVSKDDKLADEQFRRAFEVDVKEVMGNNPLPDSFDVTLSADAADSQALNSFVEEIKKLDGVSYISYPEQVLQQVHSVLGVMQLLLLIFGGVMLFISLLLLNNTIRLSICSHREAISTMKLVGATKWFIIKPFLGRGALQGLLASLLALLLLAAALYGLEYTIPGLNLLSELKMLACLAISLLVAGVVISTLSTLVVVNKFVNMRSNKIYIY